MDLHTDDTETAPVANNEPGRSQASPDEVRQGVAEPAEESLAAGLVNMADFDATAQFLSDEEVGYLRSEIAREYEQDLRSNIVAALFDIFEDQPADGVREEVLDHLETMLAFQLASCSFRGVPTVLSELRTIGERMTDLTPAVTARPSTVTDRL